MASRACVKRCQPLEKGRYTKLDCTMVTPDSHIIIFAQTCSPRWLALFLVPRASSECFVDIDCSAKCHLIYVEIERIMHKHSVVEINSSSCRKLFVLFCFLLFIQSLTFSSLSVRIPQTPFVSRLWGVGLCSCSMMSR